MPLAIPPHPAFSLPANEFERALPAALQYALERRQFDEFDIMAARLGTPIDYDVQVNTRFLRLLEVAHGADLDRSLGPLNMQNVLASLLDGSHSFAFLVNSAGLEARLYLGVCRGGNPSGGMAADEHVRVLRNALQSNFPGISCGEDLGGDAFRKEVRRPLGSHSYVSAFTGIPSLKKSSNGSFVQGLERVVDSLRGEHYSYLVLAEPLSRSAMDQVIDRCRDLSTEIHSQVRRFVSAGLSSGTSQGSQTTDGYSFNIGSGILGSLLGFSVGQSHSLGTSQGVSDSKSLTTGYETLNKTALYCEEMLDHYIARLQRGRSLGFWNVGMFFLADNQNAFLRGQTIIRGLYAGSESHLEPLRVVDLTPAFGSVQEALLAFQNPFLTDMPNGPHPLGAIFHKLATPMTTDELSVVVSFPRREVPGIKLSPTAEFGINPSYVPDGIRLGEVIYQGMPLAQSVVVPVDSLPSHTFVTGITGSGKTNTCLLLLKAAYQRGVPFLVIEPAKTEYRLLMADNDFGQRVRVFTLGGESVSPFRLNPFEFVCGFNLLTHIDLLKAVFNASFPMYASMPYILEEAILEVYTDRGWDVAASANRFVDADLDDYSAYLPTLGDLYEKIDTVVRRKKYAAQLTMDITAALKARLQSLLNGGKGRMLNTQRSIPIRELMNHPTVLELRLVGDDDEKAFLMALLLVLIYEYDQVSAEEDHQSAPVSPVSAQRVRHVTLVEEAHRLLKNLPLSVSMESANARGKAVEMFTDILAEVREYGEGFIIVDQIPSKLTPDVVKNTNLKILHRLVADDDRRFVGSAMDLTEEQLAQVVRLRRGQAVLHAGHLDRSMLVQIDPIKDNLRERFIAQIGTEGLAERMRIIRRSDPSAYRRWLGCHACDAPCAYLSPWNDPDRAALAKFNLIFATWLYCDLGEAQRAWQQNAPILRTVLAQRYGSGDLTEGAFACHLVQLARRVIGGWCGYYAAAPKVPEVRVALEKGATDTFKALLKTPADEALTDCLSFLREVVWQNLALRPAQSRPGCQHCRRVCHYGYLVKYLAPAKEGVVKQQLLYVEKIPALKDNFPALVQAMCDFARKRTDMSLMNPDLADLGYCYLVNGSEQESVFAGFQKANVR
jgi:hypothetical protein